VCISPMVLGVWLVVLTFWALIVINLYWAPSKPKITCGGSILPPSLL